MTGYPITAEQKLFIENNKHIMNQKDIASILGLTPCCVGNHIRINRNNNKKQEYISETGEIWKPVVGYESLYMVSNIGRFKSVKREFEHIYKPHLDNKGYYKVCFTIKKGKKKTFLFIDWLLRPLFQILKKSRLSII